MIEVYHLKMGAAHAALAPNDYFDLTAGFNRENQDRVAPVAWRLRLYRKVASVRTGDLETAFQLTNHVNTSWDREPDPRVGVEPDGPYRSSSVGDIFVQDGRYYICADAGFREISLN